MRNGDFATSARDNNASGARRQIVGIDAIRFVAAMLVVLYHFCFWDFLSGPPVLAQAGMTMPSFGPAFQFGWVGVEVFFVISGFVIAYSAHGATEIQFLRSRFLRLVPGAWICATVSLVVYAGVLGRPVSTLIKGYLSCLVFWPFDAIDVVYWTLGVEVSFYALVFVMIRKGRLRVLEPVMLALGVATGLYWAICLTLQHAAPPEGLLHLWVLKAEGARVLQIALVQHSCFFALGVTLYAASVGGVSRTRGIAIAVLICCCLLEIVGQNGIISRIAKINLSAVPSIVTWLTAVGFIGLSIRYNAAVTVKLGRRVRLLQWIGRLTYPLYLIHDPVCFGVIVLISPLLGQYALPVAIGLAVAASALVERFPERQLRRFAGRMLFSPKADVDVLARGFNAAGSVARSNPTTPVL